VRSRARRKVSQLFRKFLEVRSTACVRRGRGFLNLGKFKNWRGIRDRVKKILGGRGGALFPRVGPLPLPAARQPTTTTTTTTSSSHVEQPPRRAAHHRKSKQRTRAATRTEASRGRRSSNINTARRKAPSSCTCCLVSLLDRCLVLLKPTPAAPRSTHARSPAVAPVPAKLHS
jgi:hypothetical protein